MTKEKKSVSAAELMAQLQRDPKYQEREQEKERARLARIAANREAAAPILQELVAAGFAVSTPTCTTSSSTIPPRSRSQSRGCLKCRTST
jgi:hypothetical protein